jgi:hypothetical protein
MTHAIEETTTMSRKPPGKPTSQRPDGIYRPCSGGCGVRVRIPEEAAQLGIVDDPKVEFICEQCAAAKRTAGEFDDPGTLLIDATDTPPEQGPVELIGANIEKIEMGYCQALARGIPDPVVVVFDLRGNRARNLADRVVGPEQNRQAVALSRVQGTIPITQWATDESHVRALIGEFNPDMAASLALRKSPGGFRVVGVAGLRLGVATLPIPATS